jgi:hypothetical protein
MTDTAKPTPPQWIEGHMPHRNGDGYGYGGEPTVSIPNAEVLIIHSELHRKIILEAGNIHSETGLTPRQLLEQRDNAYAERNQCVAALARCALALECKVSITKTNIPGWDAVWHNCVYIQLPTGQVSWHFHDGDAGLFAGLPQFDAAQWDGHDTPEKYRRVNAWHPKDQPRQLLEQRDALRRELDDTLLTVKSVKTTIEYIEERIKAALTKYEKGVQ